MQARVLRIVIGLLVCAALALPALAQNGYPLKGTWSGDMWPASGVKTHVLLEFTWETMGVTSYANPPVIKGTLNPGPDAVELTNIKVTLPENSTAKGADPWNIHFEADVKDPKTSKVTHHSVDGKLTNIGAFDKHLDGTWMAGAVKNTFKMLQN